MGKLTHKGWMGFCPVYLGEIDSPGPLVVPRLRVLEPLLSVNLTLFDLAASALTFMDPTFVPEWPLRITGKLDQPKDLPEGGDGQDE